MPKYVVARELPGAGAPSPVQVPAIAQKSCDLLADPGPPIQRLHSYVTDDRIHCVYIAPSAELVADHAKPGGFPANRSSAVRRVFEATTAECG